MINVLTLNRLISGRFKNYFYPAHYNRKLSGYPDCYVEQHSIKNALIKRYRKCYSRLGYETVFQFEYDQAQLQSGLHHYAVEIKVNKSQQQYICISLQDGVLATIVDDFSLTVGSNYDGTEVIEQFAQLIHNINYSVCRHLNRKGYNVKHGLVQYHLPQSSHSTMAYCTIKNLTR